MNNLKHESSPMPVTLVRPMGIFPEKAPKERWSGEFPWVCSRKLPICFMGNVPKCNGLLFLTHGEVLPVVEGPE